MNLAAVEQIAKAVLYEGYMLYPYRPTSVKNQQRFNFGVVYPRAYSDAQNGCDPWTMQSECLLEGASQADLEARVRFLQLCDRSVEALQPESGEYRAVASLKVGEQTHYSWQEAVERELVLPALHLSQLSQHPLHQAFHLPASAAMEPLSDADGRPAGRIRRTQFDLDCEVTIALHPVMADVYRLTVSVQNVTPASGDISRQEALLQSQVSAHVVLGTQGGAFVSLLDPPEHLRAAAAECRNVGAYPVLVGEEGQRDTMLASPIILYDYPQIAPESLGDLFDGTEIDEILSLRILTMTDEEKREIRQSDARARQMLDRTESLPAEHLIKLHGVLRGLRPVKEEAS